jgi:hypothetical protein
MRNQFDPAVSYHFVIRPCKTAARNGNRNDKKTQFRAGTESREKETGVQKKPEANRTRLIDGRRMSDLSRERVSRPPGVKSIFPVSPA